MDFQLLGPNLETYVLGTFALALLIQLFYFLFFFVRVAAKPKQKGNFRGPVSVVIAAKNEARNLQKYLPKLFEQDYHDYEVIVVNDGSWDDSQDVLKELSARYPRLHVVTLQDNGEDLHFSKKLAVTLGIKGAKHDHLLFIDADCVPVSKQWISTMVQQFSDKKSLVLGYGAYQREKKLVNWFIRFDTLQIGAFYLSFAKAGMPYMGVGRNMAYTKKLFFDNQGFKSHYYVESGDDDLFVKEVGRKKNTAVAYHPDAQTVSQPEESWSAWFKQKKRHFGTAPHYRFSYKMLLFLYPFSLLLFYASMTTLLILQFWWIPVLAAVGLRVLLQIAIFNGITRHLGQRDLLLFSPLIEVFLMAIHGLIYLSNTLTTKKAWRS